MKQQINIQWHSGSAKGYTDIFPVEEFEREVAGAERMHLVLGPCSGEYDARYLLTVHGLEATLDYSAFRSYNRPRGMELGVLRLYFKTKKRTHVEWSSWNRQDIRREAAIATVAHKGLSTPEKRIAQGNRKYAKQLLRPGQAEFRVRLERVYGARCCITGCAVSPAVEAAHLRPYIESLDDSPTNGLLLRRDLHALFDADLLGIEPKTRRVYFAVEPRQFPEYAALHAKATLRLPQPGFDDAVPQIAALHKRWRAFRKENPDWNS